MPAGKWSKIVLLQCPFFASSYRGIGGCEYLTDNEFVFGIAISLWRLLMYEKMKDNYCIPKRDLCRSNHQKLQEWENEYDALISDNQDLLCYMYIIYLYVSESYELNKFSTCLFPLKL